MSEDLKLAEGISPPKRRGDIVNKEDFVFDKASQYGDWHTMNEGSDETYEIAKEQLMPQMEKFIPKEYRHLVVWIRHHFEESSIKVKDDNYEMLGLTKSEIGTRMDIPESWTIAWKYTPEDMHRKTLDCDKLVKAKS